MQDCRAICFALSYNLPCECYRSPATAWLHSAGGRGTGCVGARAPELAMQSKAKPPPQAA